MLVYHICNTDVYTSKLFKVTREDLRDQGRRWSKPVILILVISNFVSLSVLKFTSITGHTEETNEKGIMSLEFQVDNVCNGVQRTVLLNKII